MRQNEQKTSIETWKRRRDRLLRKRKREMRDDWSGVEATMITQLCKFNLGIIPITDPTAMIEIARGTCASLSRRELKHQNQKKTSIEMRRWLLRADQLKAKRERWEMVDRSWGYRWTCLVVCSPSKEIIRNGLTKFVQPRADPNTDHKGCEWNCKRHVPFSGPVRFSPRLRLFQVTSLGLSQGANLASWCTSRLGAY